MDIKNFSIELSKCYDQFKLKNYNKKLFTYSNLLPLIDKYKNLFNISIIGKSIKNRNIYEISINNNNENNNHVIIFSQMHGDETTGTYSIFDVLNFFHKHNISSLFLMNKLNFHFIPMLNPDGAEKFIRYNAIGIDLNRDAIYKCSPEINVLLDRIYYYNPIMVFNLHDKRRIFNVYNTSYPSIISFLSPSTDIGKSINYTRQITMGLIAFIYKGLYQLIPNNISRFSDDFYPTAIGDNLHIQHYPCILIEAGYCNNDDNKILTRKYNTISLLIAFHILSLNINLKLYYKDYFNIPQNDNKMIDELYINIIIEKHKKEFTINLGVKIVEYLYNHKLFLDKIIYKIGGLNEFYPRKIFDIKYKRLINIKDNTKFPTIGESIKNFIFK